MDLGERAARFRFRFLVRDLAGQFAASFDAAMTDAGIAVSSYARGDCGRTASPDASR
jgi:hypothetical protein